PQALVANLRTPGGETRLVDALEEIRSSRALVESTLSGVTASGEEGQITGIPRRKGDRSSDRISERSSSEMELRNIAPEHGSAALQYGERYLLKVYRRTEEGVSPEREMGTFLEEHAPGLTPPMAGVIEYRRRGNGPSVTLAVLQTFVRNEGTAWT